MPKGINSTSTLLSSYLLQDSFFFNPLEKDGFFLISYPCWVTNSQRVEPTCLSECESVTNFYSDVLAGDNLWEVVVAEEAEALQVVGEAEALLLVVAEVEVLRGAVEDSPEA